MENIQHCRAMGSLFRQFAVFDPVHSWKYLSKHRSGSVWPKQKSLHTSKNATTTESMAPELRPTA